LGEEYLRLCIAIKVLAGVDEAIAHIARYSTKHSEAIITQDEEHARRFLRQVDSPPFTGMRRRASPTGENSASALRWA